MSETLRFALEYVDRGWPVIPVSGKTPLIAWSAYQERTPSVTEVQDWFSEEVEHQNNVAVITGRTSGLVVIDCDTAQDAAWWQDSIPETPLRVRTGRSGTHFYYRYPKTDVRNRAGILGRKIDVRGEGGLVVAPPSVHRETGRAYRWETWGPGAAEEIPLFDPSWLDEPTSSEAVYGSHAPAMNAEIRHGLAYIWRIEAVSGSGGHNATFRAACKLRDSGMSCEQAIEVLTAWNESNAKPPWSPKELAHKVHDAFRTCR